MERLHGSFQWVPAAWKAPCAVGQKEYLPKEGFGAGAPRAHGGVLLQAIGGANRVYVAFRIGQEFQNTPRIVGCLAGYRVVGRPIALPFGAQLLGRVFRARINLRRPRPWVACGRDVFAFRFRA